MGHRRLDGAAYIGDAAAYLSFKVIQVQTGARRPAGSIIASAAAPCITFWARRVGDRIQEPLSLIYGDLPFRQHVQDLLALFAHDSFASQFGDRFFAGDLTAIEAIEYLPPAGIG
jgi:hypothetical protein